MVNYFTLPPPHGVFYYLGLYCNQVTTMMNQQASSSIIPHDTPDPAILLLPVNTTRRPLRPDTFVPAACPGRPEGYR